jgi:hypothetical protein
VRNGKTKKPACTDTLCTWNESNVQGVCPAPIAQIQFYSEAAKQKIKVNSRRRAEPTPRSPAAQQAFIKRLMECSAGKKNPPNVLSLFK